MRINRRTPDQRKAQSRLRQQLDTLLRAHVRLLHELIELTYHPLVAGSLITKYKRCNKGGCRCTRGELHGPFWYLSQTVEGRTVMRFIRAADASRVRPASERARRWRQMRAQLVRMQARSLTLLDKLAARATVPLERLVRAR